MLRNATEATLFNSHSRPCCGFSSAMRIVASPDNHIKQHSYAPLIDWSGTFFGLFLLSIPGFLGFSSFYILCLFVFRLLCYPGFSVVKPVPNRSDSVGPRVLRTFAARALRRSGRAVEWGTLGQAAHAYRGPGSSNRTHSASQHLLTISDHNDTSSTKTEPYSSAWRHSYFLYKLSTNCSASQ